MLGLALLRHLSMIWAQARQLTSLPLIYITLLGLHTLYLEVYDKKNSTSEEKKDAVASFYEKDATSAEAHLPSGLSSQREQYAAPANLDTSDHHCKTDSNYSENESCAEGEESDKGREKHESQIDRWRLTLLTRMRNGAWIRLFTIPSFA